MGGHQQKACGIPNQYLHRVALPPASGSIFESLALEGGCRSKLRMARMPGDAGVRPKHTDVPMPSRFSLRQGNSSPQPQRQRLQQGEQKLPQKQPQMEKPLDGAENCPVKETPKVCSLTKVLSSCGVSTCSDEVDHW